MNCSPGKGCVAQENYDTYRVDEYGLVNGTFSSFFVSLRFFTLTYIGTENMMAEISERGPIACTVAVTEAENYSGGIFRDDTVRLWITRFRSLDMVPEDGIDYWIGRNSWGMYIFFFFLFFVCTLTLTYIKGTFWGEDGWFRIVRGLWTSRIPLVSLPPHSQVKD